MGRRYDRDRPWNTGLVTVRPRIPARVAVARDPGRAPQVSRALGPARAGGHVASERRLVRLAAEAASEGPSRISPVDSSTCSTVRQVGLRPQTPAVRGAARLHTLSPFAARSGPADVGRVRGGVDSEGGAS